MFREAYQSGLFSIFYSCGPSPLELWDMKVKNGYIRRITDEDVRSLALDLTATNVTTTYIFCPKNPRKSLGIRMPFLVMIIKNMKKYFTFEITVLDDKNIHRRFRMSNFQSVTKIRDFCTALPIGLSRGWNQINFNLSDFTRRAYRSNYVETVRIQIHANCRIRRIYFADRLLDEKDLPKEYKLYFPIQQEKRENSVKESSSKNRPEEIEDLTLAAQKSIPKFQNLSVEEILQDENQTQIEEREDDSVKERDIEREEDYRELSIASENEIEYIDERGGDKSIEREDEDMVTESSELNAPHASDETEKEVDDLELEQEWA